MTSGSGIGSTRRAATHAARRLVIGSRGRLRTRAGRVLVRRAVYRRLFWGHVDVLDRAFGAEAATHWFWRVPGYPPDWRDVRRRLTRLVDAGSAVRQDFVESCLAATSDPAIVAGLARHPVGQEHLHDWLRSALDEGALDPQLRQRWLVRGALAGAGSLLLQPEDATRLGELLLDGPPSVEPDVLQIRDSLGIAPALVADGTFCAPVNRCRHRLVICETADEVEDLSLLFTGADQVTLISTSDTFGRADFSQVCRGGHLQSVNVEHTRSRITRFSAPYIETHLATVAVAQRVVDEVAAATGLLDPHDRAVLAIDVNDFLFFQALKVRAIETLLEDSAFDHVIVALDQQRPGSEFIRLLSGVDGLLSDRRLEFVSIARTVGARTRFWRLLDEIEQPTEPVVPVRAAPRSAVLKRLSVAATELSRNVPRVERGDRPLVYVMTAPAVAYAGSVRPLVEELLERFDVEMISVDGLAEASHHVTGVSSGQAPSMMTPSGSAETAPLSSLLLRVLRRSSPVCSVASSPAERAVVCALRSTLPRLCGQVLSASMLRMLVVERWLEQAMEAGEAPDLIVLVPQRHPAVAQIAPVARRLGIPSLAVEPHLQDANYCRYLKIFADYYGVVSEFFRRQATTGFGMPEDRVRTIGSPRLVAPLMHDPVAAQRAARERLRTRDGVDVGDDELVLAFFGQPSDWNHVTRVWDLVLEAARRTGSRVLLKPHPEEATTRRHRYLAQADTVGMAAEVVVVDDAPEFAIDLADIVLTGYSTAAIDAVLRYRPVVSVTVGDVDYPVDLSAIVDAPTIRSVEQLIDVIDAYREDPDQFMAVVRAVLDREAQFVEGPGPRLRRFVDDIVAVGGAGLRSPKELPSSVFLDGPHPVFLV